MKERRKILFTDLDGTLLNEKKQITPATQQVLEEILRAGNYVVLISGRPMPSVVEAAQQIPDHEKYAEQIFYVASNGGQIKKALETSILRENRLDFSQVSQAFVICDALQIHCQTYTPTHIVAKEQTKELSFYQRTIHMPSLITEDIIGALGEKPPFKCVALSLEGRSRLNQVKEVLEETFGEQVTLLFSNDILLEMIPASSGKGAALAWLSDYLQVSLQDTLAAGDQDNDISMLQMAGMGVAVQNASKGAKEAADLITAGSNQEDGLVEVIRDFFLKESNP